MPTRESVADKVLENIEQVLEHPGRVDSYHKVILDLTIAYERLVGRESSGQSIWSAKDKHRMRTALNPKQPK